MTNAGAEYVQDGGDWNRQYRSKNQQREPGNRNQREESAHETNGIAELKVRAADEDTYRRMRSYLSSPRGCRFREAWVLATT